MSDIFIADETMLRKLRICLKNNWNVLFTGRHGTGKTSVVKALWDSAGLNYKMFSAATMDPWVDFIGIPKEAQDEEGKYLEFIKRKSLGDVEAFFFDEYNRSNKKIRNAVMELIQFKSMNDEIFPNLRVIWAAINPDDDDSFGGKIYDVERLDPAQKDRFQIQIHMPYKPVKSYFSFRYGEEVASAAIKWWENLDSRSANKKSSQDRSSTKLTDLVSPRRLDYAIEVLLSDGPVEDVFPPQVNASEFKKLIQVKPLFATLKKLFNNDDVTGAKKFLSDENTYDQVKTEILKSSEMIKFFVPLLPPERINALIHSDIKVKTWALKEYPLYPTVENALKEICEVGTNKVLAKQIEKKFNHNKIGKASQMDKSPTVNAGHEPPVIGKSGSSKDFDSVLKNLNKQDLVVTNERDAACKLLNNVIPEDMSLEQSEEALLVLDKIISHSHVGSMDKRFPTFMGLINACVKNMKEKGYDFTQFKNKYMHVLEYVVKFPGFYLEIQE